VRGWLAWTVAAVWLCGCGSSQGAKQADPVTGPEVTIEALLKAPLALADGVEVIVSRVSVPAGEKLPLHTHPGEEFVHVVAGSGTLELRGKDPVPLAAGQSAVVPLGAVHAFTAGPRGARAIVFRVHEQGKPPRTLVPSGDR